MHLTQSLTQLIDCGGEGVILRRPRSAYFRGRSTDLIKIKAMRSDMEGLVVKVKKNYIKLQLPNGTAMSVNTEDIHLPKNNNNNNYTNTNDNNNNNNDSNNEEGEGAEKSGKEEERERGGRKEIMGVREGDVVSFTYTMVANRSLPTQVRVYRIRRDILWRDVLLSFSSSNSPLPLNEVSQRGVGMAEGKAVGYRGMEKKRQMRKEMEEFARSQDLDPLLADTWYKLSKNPYLMRQSCKVPWNAKFSGSIVKAVITLFPKISFDEEKFAIAPRHHWFSSKNRRDFFETYAKEHNFDPLVPDNWYLHDTHMLRSFKGAEGILRHFDGNFAKALIHVFPEIGLDTNKLHRKYWLNSKNQQDVFIEFAQQQGFSAFSADSWYSVHPDTFNSSKNVSLVLQFYDGSYAKALVHLFPNIGLSEKQLQEYWADHFNRKQMFINFSKERGHNPEKAESWYSMDLAPLVLQKGITSVLRYYDGSVARALTILFPNIGLDENKLQKRYWLDMKNKQQIFIKFAKEKQFDHLNAKKWYEADLSQVPIPMKPHLLANHRLQCVKLLLHLFPNIGLDKANFNVGLGKQGLDIQTRREFFLNFAKEKGFDPLVATNWYSVSNDELFSTKAGRLVASRYGGSFPRALLHLFPSIGLEKNKLSTRSLLVWKDVENKRQFFADIAKDKGFDPLVASNWYSITLNEIMEYKGSRSILPQYNGSFIDALESLFKFDFDKTKFAVPWHKYWRVTENRRKVFEELAKKRGFNPLNVNNWYKVTLDDLSSHESGEKMLRYYEGNVIAALQHVYPQLEFNPKKFVLHPHYWLNMENRKQFFVSYAREHGFDPLIPENWYSVDPKSILNDKIVKDLLPDRPSIVKNLLHVFKDIGLDKTKFKFLPGKYWITDTKRARELFLHFAKDKGFDPLVPNNWYSLSEEEILSHENARELISYQKSFSQGVVTVFPEIGLQINQFASVDNTSKLVVSPRRHWYEVTNQRAMFVAYAKKSGFEPLVPENWYTKTFESMADMKGRRNVQDQYKLLSAALQTIFPEVNFDTSKFKVKEKKQLLN